MDLWQRARVFAEEAAKKSQEISIEAAKRSQELTKGAAKFSQEFVSETAKKSKEFAAEASKKADSIKIEALKRADQIKALAGEIPLPIGSDGSGSSVAPDPQADLERFGVTDELREFVKGITLSTFRDFPMEDEPEMQEVPTLSNVRQDLSEWQARHATLVLSTVTEISKFRYELCPRYMKERKFWRIYFILVSSYVAPYEKQYAEEVTMKKKEQSSSDRLREASTATPVSEDEVKETKSEPKGSSSKIEQDLDVFLLGDLGSEDDGPDGGDDGFDDDFDKNGKTGLESDEDGEGEKKS
ncbi:BSD domain-containing protein [Dioscorea alata]|uniref:BSD domain-containing protein n=1 Tax=Dioscorea alata TaxID=55571 RepID=A0ACB7WLD8_DIOAL|nr:BSD domain-containing protein [Dioscorea alata]